MVWAQLGPNAPRAAARRGVFWPPSSAPHAQSGRVTRSADLGVKGLSSSIDFGSLRIGSDLRFRNGADSHKAAAKESTYV
jgi:hypothetical protein